MAKQSTKKGEKIVASLVIKDASKMNDGGRLLVAKWLREKAHELIENGWNYSDTFTAKYIVVKDAPK